MKRNIHGHKACHCCGSKTLRGAAWSFVFSSFVCLLCLYAMPHHHHHEDGSVCVEVAGCDSDACEERNCHHNRCEIPFRCECHISNANYLPSINLVQTVGFDLFCELPLEFWEVDFLLLKQPKKFVEDFALFERFVYRLNALRAPPFFV